MKSVMKFLCHGLAVMMAPVVANAAGTYYTGAYQSPQTNRYAQQSYSQRSRTTSYSQQGVSSYNRNQYANAGYSVQNNRATQQNKSTQRGATTAATQTSKQGFTLGAGLSRQTSMWQFEMKDSDSILHYDNIDWNVFDVNANYGFMAGNTPMRVTAGFKYGMQSGESTMIDDDITNGGYFVTEWVDGNVCEQQDEQGNCIKYKYLGDQVGNALSIGTSKKGSMMEFNGGIGLTDFFKWGNVKVTPTLGWRYLKYTLETHNNKGLSVDTYTGQGGCFTVDGSDEVQCDTVLIFYDSAGNQYLAHRVNTSTAGDKYTGEINGNDEIPIPSGAYEYVNAGGTYFYDQPGVSHKYEVEWSGPYFALDMLYDINQYNSVNAYVELGLPSYTATGDQPYRFDWEHPKSVEDSAGVGSALHLGLGANWSTAITDTVALSVGVTYDYYNVSDADAKTFLSEDYYMGIYNNRLDVLYDGDEAKMLAEDAIAQNIALLQDECPGWVCTANGEIESFYKSLGVRIGINARF